LFVKIKLGIECAEFFAGALAVGVAIEHRNRNNLKKGENSSKGAS